MPVLVALLKEAFWKPAEVVTRAVPVRGVVRSARRDDDPSHPAQEAMPPESERVPQAGEIPGASRSYRGPSWRAAVVTGLLGFVIAAVIITVPEFVAGKSAAGGDRGTTLFGGEERSSSDDDDEEDNTDTTAPTETQGAPPASTVTVPPVETTTVPAQTTTVPPAQTTPEPPAQPPPPVTPEPEPEP